MQNARKTRSPQQFYHRNGPFASGEAFKQAVLWCDPSSHSMDFNSNAGNGLDIPTQHRSWWHCRYCSCRESVLVEIACPMPSEQTGPEKTLCFFQTPLCSLHITVCPRLQSNSGPGLMNCAVKCPKLILAKICQTWTIAGFLGTQEMSQCDQLEGNLRHTLCGMNATLCTALEGSARIPGISVCFRQSRENFHLTQGKES